MKRRNILRKIFDSAVEAVAPDQAVKRHLQLKNNMLHVDNLAYPLQGKKILVLGAGKGVAPMAKAIEDTLGSHIVDGLVITKYEHSLPLQHIKIIEAAHPVPDDAGLAATKMLLDKAKLADENTLVLCLFTGGASALTPSLVEGLELAHVQDVTKQLLQSGATIHEINALRKHLSTFSGGQLARAAAPAEVVTLIVSDVIGDELDVIASGPTAPDPSTFTQCQKIINKFSLEDKLPSAVQKHLLCGCQGQIIETPKSDDPLFDKVRNVLVATNAEALLAAKQCAESLGFNVHMLQDPIQGEAKEQSVKLVNLAKNMSQEMIAQGQQKPICILAGGETTVTICGQGKGGRNQEMALSAALELEGVYNIATLFAGTDGTDGPTDAAGGYACGKSAIRLRKVCNPLTFLSNNDSYHALKMCDDLLITGPTRTNVMDLSIILIWP